MGFQSRPRLLDGLGSPSYRQMTELLRRFFDTHLRSKTKVFRLFGVVELELPDEVEYGETAKS
jgi:hypothetical protein